MEKNIEKNNTTLKLLLTIFLIVSLALGGFILYDKVLKKEESIPSKPVETNSGTSTKNNDENTLPEWANYVLSQDITEITYGYAIYPNNDSNFECKKKNMTKEQLKRVLEKMTTSKLKKYNMGGAGSDCNDEGILVKYGNKSIEIWRGTLISVDSTNDSEVLSLLEKDVDIREEIVGSDPWIVFQYEWDSTYIDNLLGI